MTAKELKKLSREDLLELLIEQSDMLAKVSEELEEAKAQLAKRTVIMEKSGTMAEAALALNGIFEAADNAAKQYLDSLKAVSEVQSKNTKHIETETRARCEKIIEAAKAKAQSIIEQAEEESRKKKKAADKYMRAAVKSANELRDKANAQSMGE